MKQTIKERKMSTMKLYTAPEILGALTANLSNEEQARFTKNPTEFLNQFGVENVTVKTATNSETEVNIALPYYSELNQNPPACMSDDDMEGITGAGKPGMSDQQATATNAVQMAAGIAEAQNYRNQGYDVTISTSGNVVHGKEDDGSGKNQGK